MLVACLCATGHLRAQATAPPAAVDDIDTAPVVIDGAVLFNVRGVSSFPAEARARGIQERIVAIAGDRAISPDSVRIVESQGATRILAGDRPIMQVAEADANLEQLSVPELAAVHQRRIQQAIADYRAARTGGALRSATLTTVVATLLLLAAYVALQWLSRMFDRLLIRRLQARVQSVEIKTLEVMRADQIWGAVRSGVLGIRTLVLLGIFLLYLGFVLAQWPWTHGLSQNIVSFAVGPLQVIGRGIIANIPSLVFLAVLFYVIRAGLKAIRLFFEAVERGTLKLAGFYPDWAQPTYKIVRLAVIAFGLVVAYPYIPGSQSEAFKGVSLFIGIVFSLGSSTAIANMIAGYMMTYRRAFKIGDRVKIGDTIGEVIQTRLQVTHLRSPKNEEIVIPNSEILSGEVLNYSSLARETGLILHTEVGIGYETPWRQVEAMLLSAAERTPGLVREPPAFVLLKKLADFAVTYELNVFSKDVKAMMATYTALHRNILDVFNEYGVQIMTPAYEGDPAEPKVVPPKDWYAAPASRQAEVPTQQRV
jgi:small-conductance mechanosensitive channel